MEARGEVVWLPGDLPCLGGVRTAHDNLEQAVARTDEPAVIGLDSDRRPIAADARIDDAEKYGVGGEPQQIGCQQIRRRLRILHGRISEEIDDRHARRPLQQHGFDLPGVGPSETEIAKEDDHRPRLASLITRMAALRPGAPETAPPGWAPEPQR